MNKIKRNFIISGALLLFAFVFTLLVKTIDVQEIGPNGSLVGFASVNQFFFKLIGIKIVWYYITDWLGIVPIAMALGYGVVGLVQLVKRRSFLRVDKEILALGAFYFVLIFLYLFFETVVINYRPVLINGFLEASYPSSHTLMAICLCGSAIIVNKRLFKSKVTQAIDILSAAIIVITVVGRFISGVHWFTDILGGIILSSALLTTFYSIIFVISYQGNRNENKK
jgi:undecaprenyl-diphosphatase